MIASDVMGRNVATIAPDKTIQDAAGLMLSRGVSGLPVVGKGGELLGMLSEGDLMRHADAGTEHRPSWWLRLVATHRALAEVYVKEHSRRVEDVMTRKVITAKPDTPVREVANLLESNRIKRLPIVENGKLVGIVSRADLIQMLACTPLAQHSARSDEDRALREAILLKVDKEEWARGSLINVSVTDRSADLWGIVNSSAEKKALRVAAETTPGIRSVTDNTFIRPLDSCA